MSTTAIHIAYCFDNNFWAPAYATMRSICLATHRRTDLVFHLCHTGLTTDHSADLDRIPEEFGATLDYQDVRDNETFQRIGLKGRYHPRLTYIIYARLLIEHILPPEVERATYLDCDMYVRAPIEQVAEMDLEGFPIAAVRDPHSFHIIGGQDLRQNQDLFHLADPYFNSGFMVIDMEKWKQADVSGRLETMIEDGTMDRLYYDQDVLNLIFKHNWLKLPQLWNTLTPRHPHEAFDPPNLHFTGPRKPWHLVSGVAFARTYRHVMTNDIFYRFFWFRTRRRLKRWIGLK